MFVFPLCLRSDESVFAHSGFVYFVSVFADFPVLSVDSSFLCQHEWSFSNHNIINICIQVRLALKNIVSNKFNDPFGFHKFTGTCQQWEEKTLYSE